MKSIDVFFKSFSLLLYGGITVATCAAVWNSNTSGVLAVIAALLFVANGFVIYRKAKALEKAIKDNGGIR